MTIIPRNDRLRRDIASCLQVTDQLIPYLVPDRDFSRGEIDEEVKTSAEATFIGACNKLDTLIEGLGRYEVEETIEKKLIEGAEVDIAARREQVTTAKNCRRPSVIFRPEISKTQHGAWAAYYGDITQPENCIIGVGATVEEAMLDFDNEWTNKKSKLQIQTETTKSPETNTYKGRKKQ